MGIKSHTENSLLSLINPTVNKVECYGNTWDSMDAVLEVTN